MPIAAGDSAPGFRLGDSTPSRVYAGDTLVWSSFAPSRMNKSGAGSNLTTTFAQVTGWAADTVTAPGSSVSGNDLVVQTAWTGASVEVSVEWASSTFLSRTVTLQLKQSGTIIATGTATSVPANGSAVVALSATGLTVSAGDLIRLEARASGTSISATNNPASYVRVVKP